GGASLAAGVRALDASPAIALPAAAASLLVPAAWWGIVAVRTKRDAARIVGGYRLGRVLGEGASGVVFEARSVATGERVAIKRLRYSLLARPGEREVFRREAELGASVDHPNVVRILGYGEWRAPTDAAPAAWLVLELLGGPTLRDVLDQRGPLPCGDAAGLARDLAAGLAAVHAAGVLHRDVKPQNVAFAGDGTVKLMDFGAARPTARRTETVDRFFGTVGYLSPERLRGEPATVRSDVYALGVVLYECIAGARPGDDLAALATPTAPARPARPDLPDALWAAVARAIDPDPEARFPSAEAFADALAPFACRAPPPALPRGPVAPPAPVASHLATAWGLARAYLRYAWDGGRPDADAFAARWLSRSGEAPPAEPTNRRDP
ncbi:MAG: serine/threonine-protein kinase, partial [Myxococcota bacterium]